jgi:hypothetical protein
MKNEMNTGEEDDREREKNKNKEFKNAGGGSCCS